MSAPSIHTERLILRLPQAQDLEAATHYFSTERSKWTGGPLSQGDSFRAYAAARGHWEFLGFGMFAVQRKDETAACGLAGPWKPTDRPEGEIGWNLWRDDLEGQSIAFEAATAARTWAYANIGWATAVSYVHPNNHRSIRLAERLGAWDDTDASPALPEFPDTRIYRHPAPEALI